MYASLARIPVERRRAWSVPSRCCRRAPSSYCQLCLLHVRRSRSDPLLGTGEVRFAPEALEAVRAAVRAAGGRLAISRGDARLGRRGG